MHACMSNIHTKLKPLCKNLKPSLFCFWKTETNLLYFVVIWSTCGGFLCLLFLESNMVKLK
uniref:Uncharacterized protein n=1 Tax=Oryza brachyantha TaxID=4533 RepID=J3MA01_ORYBR